MQLLVTIDHRFDRTPDGSIWTPTNHSYSFWTRYLSVFERVKVAARVREVRTPPPRGHRADGERVTFDPVPYYLGPLQYISKAMAVHRAVRSSLTVEDAVIMRVGSQLANCLEPALIASGHPFGLEVVGDPFDMFSSGCVKHPLRRFFQWWFPRRLRSQCAAAAGVAYVTEHTLQKFYPCGQYKIGMSDVELDGAAIRSGRNAFATSYSSVELTEKDTLGNPRSNAIGRCRVKLITVATLAQPYKGVDVLIRSVHLCRSRGFDVVLNIVGDGKCRGRLQALTGSLHLDAYVTFLGNVPSGDAVRGLLDASDVFVLASRGGEGLPRVLIEAMARGLPCIATCVGGIPELLQPEDMAPSGNIAAFARKIMDVVSSQERMLRMSARNLRRSQDFRGDLLEARRRAFYSHIRQVTAEWLTQRSA